MMMVVVMMVMIADSDDGDDDGNDNGDEDEERTPTFHEVERFSCEKRDTAIWVIKKARLIAKCIQISKWGWQHGNMGLGVLQLSDDPDWPDTLASR